VQPYAAGFDFWVGNLYLKKISKMNLPVDDWETMEQEIESGAVNE
jgi:hypothetical protein